MSIFIPMQPENVTKILKGEKTSTVRSASAAQQIGLKKGQQAYTTWGGKRFLVTCEGEQTIGEAGGKESVWKSEGFGPSGPLYAQTKTWLSGTGKLWVYRFVAA